MARGLSNAVLFEGTTAKMDPRNPAQAASRSTGRLVVSCSKVLGTINAMTQMAREVLGDCRDALAEFEHGAQGSKWRRWWIMNVALLRAVGHVLDRVDAPRTPEAKQAINEAWPEIESAEIFSKFIKRERNIVLKEYRLGATQTVSVALRGQAMRFVGRNPPRVWGSRVQNVHGYAVTTEPFAGRSPTELIAEAIQFWSDRLDAIDRRIEELRAD